MVPPASRMIPKSGYRFSEKIMRQQKDRARIVPRPMVSLSVRCALAAVLALGLGACGRKGDLDPPPGRFSDPRVTDAQPAPAPGPDGQIAAPPGAAAAPVPQPAAKKTTPLDWLLN
jgi:predicted small lipoprotein YifL